MTQNAPVPEAASAARFEAAKQATDQRDAKSLGASDRPLALQEIVISGTGTTSKVEKLGSAVDSVGSSAPRRANNHLFTMRDGKWTDVAFKDGMKLMKIKAFSPAYFQVLDAIPELRESFAVGQKVIVTGKHISIEITDSGAAQLGDAELRSLKEQW